MQDRWRILPSKSLLDMLGTVQSESRTLGTGRGLQGQEHGETAAPFVSGWNPNKVITAGPNPSEPQESRKSRAVRRGSDRRFVWGESQTVSSLIDLLGDLGQVTTSKFEFSALQKELRTVGTQ